MKQGINMDPRNFSVKPCPAAFAAKSSADIGSAVSDRRNTINSIGKIGDLEVLNSVGAGAIGTGLRTIASVSNSIRTGCGALPSTIGDSVDQGANWILDHLGISPTVIQTLQDFNPDVANRAWGQAKQVFQQVQQGHFKITDIPYYLQDFQDLERLARGIYTPGDDRLNALTPRCEASPYAVDMIARAPKYKFLFMVQFITAAGYSELDSIMRGMAFVVKKSSRPKITYQTENVNFYNFRTKVIIKSEFEEMSMTFHDDILNNTTAFYTAYLKAMTPISNMSPETASTQDSFEQLGMSFKDNTLSKSGGDQATSNKYAASIGPLNNDNKQGVFKEIILYHVYDYGLMVNVYHFLNPKITQLMPDDVDMSISNEGSELGITFVYDSVYVETKSMKDLDDLFRGAQSDAVYQLRYNDDASSTQGPNSKGINPYGTPTTGQESCNPMSPQNTSSKGGLMNGIEGISGTISSFTSGLF
jgi:hypothetical protein